MSIRLILSIVLMVYECDEGIIKCRFTENKKTACSVN